MWKVYVYFKYNSGQTYEFEHEKDAREFHAQIKTFLGVTDCSVENDEFWTLENAIAHMKKSSAKEMQTIEVYKKHFPEHYRR